MSLGQTILNLRRKRGLPQEALAGPITRAAVSLIERGRTCPTVETVDWITHCLELAPGTFYEQLWAETSSPQALLALAERALALNMLPTAKRAAIKSYYGFKGQNKYFGMEQALILLGRAEVRRRPQRAELVWSVACNHALRHRNWDQAALAQYHRGRLFYQRAAWLEAHHALAMAAEYAEHQRNGEPSVRLNIHRLLGNVLLGQQLYAAAIESYSLTLRLAQELNNPEAAAASHMGLGVALRREGRLEEALRHSAAALEYYRSTQPDVAAGVYANQAQAYQALGAWNQVRHAVLQGLRLVRHDPTTTKGYLLNELGEFLLATNRPRTAEFVVRRAQPYLAGALHARERALSQRLLARALAAQNQSEAALIIIHKAMEELQSLPLPLERVQLELEAALMHLAASDLARAKSAIESSLVAVATASLA